jgi:hypothetical protein
MAALRRFTATRSVALATIDRSIQRAAHWQFADTEKLIPAMFAIQHQQSVDGAPAIRKRSIHTVIEFLARHRRSGCSSPWHKRPGRSAVHNPHAPATVGSANKR